MKTPGALRDSSVSNLSSLSGTPPPETSALENPASPVTRSGKAESASSSRVRSSLRSSAARRSGGTPAAAHSAAAKRAGRCADSRVAASCGPGAARRASHAARPSPVQSASSGGCASRGAVTTRCDRSSTEGPEKPLWLNKNPPRCARPALEPSPQRSATVCSDTPASSLAPLCAAPGCAPSSGTSAGKGGTTVWPSVRSAMVCPVPVVPTAGKERPPVDNTNASALRSDPSASVTVQRPPSRRTPSTLAR